MRSVISCIGIVLLWSHSPCAGDTARPPSDSSQPPIAVANLDPKLDHKQVTIKFAVSELGGVAQLSIPGKAPTFVIEATSAHEKKDLTVWIEGDLADVLDRLQLSFLGTNPLKKGTVIVATGSLTFSPGDGTRKDHEWYALHVEKWQNFRIVGPDGDQ